MLKHSESGPGVKSRLKSFLSRALAVPSAEQSYSCNCGRMYHEE